MTASAISARGRTEATETNSSGWWAWPPRGPRPSTVRSIVAARWLASLAPPRAPARSGRPRSAAAGAIRRSPTAARESIPGQRRTSSASRSTPSIAGGTTPATPSSASSRSPRRSQTSSPSAGTTLNASPARTTVGTAVSRSVAGGVGARGDQPGGLAEREQGVAALLRRGARVRRDPVRADAQRGRRLALGDHGLLAAGRAGRPRSRGRRRSRRSAPCGRSRRSATPRRRRRAGRAPRSSPGSGPARA